MWKELQHPIHPIHDLHGRLPGDMGQHKLEDIVGLGKRKYPQKPCRICAAHWKTRGTSAPSTRSLFAKEAASKGTTHSTNSRFSGEYTYQVSAK
jgi:hypothetical protein